MRNSGMKMTVGAMAVLFAAVSWEGMAQAKGETIAEQEIYSQDGLTVTVTGLEDGLMGTEVQLMLENESDQPIGVQAGLVSVNDYMVDSMMSVELAPGKKANDALTILTDSFEEKGIETIAEVEFRLHLFDPATWETVSDSELISLVTEGNEEYEQKFDASGEALYENGGIKIVAKGIADSLMGQSLVLYMENTSENDVVVQSDSTSVNGFMLDAILSVELPQGKHAIGTMEFLQSELDENQIEQIEQIETVFHIADLESYMTITDTDLIPIALP